MKQQSSIFRAWLAVPVLFMLHTSASAQGIVDFYRGKTISMLIGYPPGGANDVYGRLVARYIGRHIPGNPTVVPMNMPGAGSLRAANHIFTAAARDGTILGLLVPTIALEAKLGSSAAKFKASAFAWIGRLAPAPNVTFLMASAPVKRIEDAFDQAAVLGATGRSATNAIYPTVLNKLLGTRFKVVTGYEGTAAAMIAMERGEVDGHSSTYDSLKAVREDWLRERKVNVVVQYSQRRHPELPSVPTAVELARTPEQAAILRAVSSGAEIGKFVLTTPETPPHRVEALRRAFDAMVADPALLAEARQLRIEIDPMQGEQLQRIVEEVEALSPAVTEKVREIFPLN